MTYTDREAQRRTRTASEERAAIFWAVVVGVTVQAVGLVGLFLFLRAILGALT